MGLKTAAKRYIRAVGIRLRPRKESDAITPTLRDPNHHAKFLYRIEQGPIGLLFLGDSIMDNWPRDGEWSWLKYTPDQPANFGVNGDATENVLWRITNGQVDGIHPKVVVLMIGTNNVGENSTEKPAWAAAGVTKIVETIHEKLPDARVLLLAVFPRGESNSRERTAIAGINEIIRTLDDGDRTRYLDLSKIFLDASGEIPADIMPDKLHLSVKGYDLWHAAMQPTLDEMMK